MLGQNGYFREGRDAQAGCLGGFANWVGLPDRGEGPEVVSFVEATEEQLVHWLDFLGTQGVTAMRFMLRAHTPKGMEPMDVIGRVNMPLFAKVLRYMDLARKRDIKFLLVIHEDYTKPAYYNQQAFETFCLPQFKGEDLDALPPYQRRFVRDRKLIGTSARSTPTLTSSPARISMPGSSLRSSRTTRSSSVGSSRTDMDCPASWAKRSR